MLPQNKTKKIQKKKRKSEVLPKFEGNIYFDDESQEKKSKIIEHRKNKTIFRCKHEGCLSVFLKNYALKRHIKLVHEKTK